MFTLKPLSMEAVPAALAKAERYRLLNEPHQAESICEDVLAAAPDHPQAIATLLLALTDQFSSRDGHLVAQAQELAARMPSPYERVYFLGLVAERRARALSGGGAGRARTAGHWFRDAMGHYAAAEEMRPPGNDDARLRWNACARVLNAHPEMMATETEPAVPLMLE
ncbi:MAG TPA: hypothetical protein VMW48_03765 [Vicinamibacterales bacterium]|nr:hypothetical protein [Vicinamibacterales bacterium]